MTKTPPSSEGPAGTVLALFAHPDDEAFRCGGTLALLAQRGHRVQVVTATRGEGGSCGTPPLCLPEELAAWRERELACSCAALGLDPPVLLDYRDGTLADVILAEAVGQVLATAHRLAPHALLTWPAHGLSGHPDHCAVSRWAEGVFAATSSLAALYHLAVPQSVAQRLGLSKLHATADSAIDLIVDVTALWETKMAAIGCHRTQWHESPILAAPLERQQLFLGVEHFVRAAARGNADPLQALL